MKTYTVTAYNVYSMKPENCRKVITTDYDAITIYDALDQAERDANRWNKDAEGEHAVTMIVCNGYVRNI